MTDRGIIAIARRLADFERRLRGVEQSARLTASTVAVQTADDDTEPLNLDVPGGVFTAFEASVDAGNAQATADSRPRVFRQDSPPDPAVVGMIPVSSLWYDTDAANRPYQWNAGTWQEIPAGLAALDANLVALITMRFPTEAARDAALAGSLTEGMQAYVAATNLSYQYSAGQWVPLLTFIRKGVDQSAPNTTYVTDNQLRVTLVPGWYRIEALLHVRGNPDADILIKWNFTGTVLTGDSRGCLGPATSADTGFATLMRTTGNNYASNIRYGLADVSSDLLIREDLLFNVSSVGELQLMFSEYQSASGSVTVGEQSRMFITKVL